MAHNARYFFSLRFDPLVETTGGEGPHHYVHNSEPVSWPWWEPRLPFRGRFGNRNPPFDFPDHFFRVGAKFFQIDSEDDDRLLLFGSDSPLVSLLPSLAANACLAAPKTPWTGPSRTYMSPSGKLVGPLGRYHGIRQEALWQLDALGWDWNTSERRARKKARGRRGGRRHLLNEAVAALAPGWVHLGAAWRARRIEIALRWFFPGDQLDEKAIETAAYRAD